MINVNIYNFILSILLQLRASFGKAFSRRKNLQQQQASSSDVEVAMMMMVMVVVMVMIMMMKKMICDVTNMLVLVLYE